MHNTFTLVALLMLQLFSWKFNEFCETNKARTTRVTRLKATTTELKLKTDSETKRDASETDQNTKQNDSGLSIAASKLLIAFYCYCDCYISKLVPAIFIFDT